MHNIRNFSIIAHVDHGKSTLADRLLQETKTVGDRDMQEQFLDKIDLERERGITIKLQAVRMQYDHDGTEYTLNLIDTPGHIDFSYEVNRSLEACEGALLLIDATQGIQAQTLANYEKAKNADLKIIPVINKIDLPAAEPEDVALDIMNTFGFSEDEIIFTSGKTGDGVPELLETIIATVPTPEDTQQKPLRALVFDSFYDQHKGVMAVVRIMDGTLKAGGLRLMHAERSFETVEVGYITTAYSPTQEIENGGVGYIATGLKDISLVRVGETITSNQNKADSPLEGYKEPKPMVFANIFPEDQDQLSNLRDAVEKYNLTDAAFTFEPIKSPIIGSGFRCGFLGLLHLDVVQERIHDEFGIPTQITPPTVLYYVDLTNGERVTVQSPDEMPDTTRVVKSEEPWCTVKIFTREEYIGGIMKVTESHRNEYVDLQYMSSQGGHDRAELVYNMPLAEVISNYFDQIKSVSSGYASIDYELTEYREVNLVKLDVLLNHEPYDILSRLVVREQAEDIGLRLVEKLKDTMPKQQYKLAIQAAIGGKVVAREDLSALRKDVTAKLYGGDRTRKDKLLKQQAAGKKRLAGEAGKISIPHDVYQEIIGV